MTHDKITASAVYHTARRPDDVRQISNASMQKSLKSKLYTFIMTYGRIGSPEEVADALEVLDALQWAPFRPSSDAQLFPIRTLEINKDMLKIRSDEKMGDLTKIPVCM